MRLARDVLDAQQQKKFQILNPGSLATVFVMVNMGAPDVSDVRVRQALAYAIDRVALNKAINRGLYKIANTPFGTGLFPHEQVDGYPGFDPAKAKKLVEDYGKPVKIKMSINAAPLSTLTAQALQQMWKKVGIETELVPYEQVQLVRTAAARDYQTMLYRWAGGADPDKNVHQFFHSKGTVNRTNFNNAGNGPAARCGPGHHQPGRADEDLSRRSTTCSRKSCRTCSCSTSTTSLSPILR